MISGQRIKTETQWAKERRDLGLKLKQHVEMLEKIGEHELAGLDANNAGRFQYAVDILRKLAEHLNSFPNPRAIAQKFSKYLEQELEEDKMREVIMLNRQYRLDGKHDQCASHEVCDANELMLRAFEDFGLGDVLECEDLQQLWGKVWDYAARAEFFQGFAKHFPRFDPYSLPPIPPTWEDTSDPTEGCPSFRTFTGRKVYIDYEERLDREIPDSSRFIVIDDPEIFDHTNIVFPSDDWDMVLRYVESGPTKYLKQRIEQLYKSAKPQSGEDWGTQRQTDAENRFLRAAECLGVETDAYSFTKPTSEEMIEDAMSQIREKFE